MSTTDPTGEGGEGGGGGESATTTNVEQTASPSTPITGTAVPVQTAAQQQQQQPQQHPPPSPLSGCYLLVVLPEPHTAQHKDLILNRLAKGFLSWDKDSCHVDLEKELLALVAQAPEGEEARNGERLIQYATENLVTEVLIHPQTNTLLQCIRNLLASFTKHRHIIHAGYTFGGNGSWILQDGTFSLADFLDAFSEHEVQRVLRAYENSVTVDIHCAGVGDWTTSRLSKEACCRSCRVRVNPDDVLTAGVPAIMSFTNYIGQYLVPQTLDQLMEPSDVVGNIRFSHPTLYVFPGGQGDAALFGINGFNMLVDGGFARKACFWDFTRHLDRLDAVLVTRINNSNIGGMFSVLRKKKEMHVYPQIGHFFCNLVERRQSNSPDGDKDIDPLVLNLTDIGQEMVVNLRHVNLRAHPCYRDPEPINLYHKVGHGTLDMYVLSPSKDSREVREFLAKWHASDSKLFAGSHTKKDSNNLTFPIQNLVSICALLVWQPANPEDNITRILFPGSTPQHKIFEGFERLKHLDFLKHPVCSAKTLSPSVSLATLRDKPTKQKFSLMEKEPKKISEPKKEKREPSEPKSIKAADETVPKSTPQSTPIISSSKFKTEMKTKKVVENKKLETEAKESKKIEKELKEVKKEPKKELAKVEKSEKREDDMKKIDLIKPEPEKTKESKEPKSKPEPKKKEPKESTVKVELKKSEVTPKPKAIEKKAKLSGVEKKDAVKSSPTTPKKTLNGAATKTEISKATPKAKPATKIAPSLPAKSAKEANNRKVVEQKKSEVAKSAVKDTAAPVVKVSAKPKLIDKKPISRRAKPISPNKARMPGSPAKSTRSTPTASVKSDKDGVIRKVKGDKGTTDSSTVSTPSGIEPEAVKPIDKSLVEQSEDISLDSIESKVLADLKEEREVVEEIEAVLQKAERTGETRKDERFEGDDEITAEATDKKEEDITEEDVTAEIEDVPKKESSRKESQELTEEDEYLIVEKEEVYTEDSAQSGEGEQKHVLDEAQSEKAKILKDVEAMKEKGEKEEPEEKGKDDSPEKKVEKIVAKEEKEIAGLSSEHKEQLQEEVKEIIASATEIVQKAEEKDDSGKKDSEEITKEPSSLSPDKLDSSEKKTTDTDVKPDVDQKENILEKMEESQERISTIESGATTTAPTLPEDERIPLDEIKEDIDEKHVIEEVKEKDPTAKLKKEVVPETVPVAAKPEVKVFDVRQAMQTLQRDIVKTPDEVADLPVHEEVDPKLYRMEDFEKGKEEKTSPTAQEGKEPPTPSSKEQKGVFSFFGKVADKFEKGIDKLTKKKKDTEKDSDEKSSSKSSSPKEPKTQEKILDEVDMEKMFPKIGKPIDKPETFEEAKPTIADVKVAAIKETTAFIQGEIQDAQRQSIPDIEAKLPSDKLDEIKKAEIEESFLAKDVSPAAVSPSKPIEDKEIAKEIELLKEEDIGEDVEEVKALLEEASKKFKTVKDSLRDSLESLEEKLKEEIVEVHETPSALKDAVKDTLEGVAEKLEEIKPHIESHLPDIKEPEKVKFAIPKDEEFEEEYEEEIEGPYRDMKEAVRDIGEVLAGTAGIELEEKPKDVIEIVKKVAEVLREDDFLSDKTLFDQAKKEEVSPILSTDKKPSKEEISPISTERKPSISSEKISPEKIAKLEEEELKFAHEDIVIPKKIDLAEISLTHEELEKPSKLLAPYEEPGAVEVKEEPCIKVVKEKDDITSPVKDVTKDMQDAQKICAEILKDDEHICDQHKKLADDDTSRVDVMQAGIEGVCVKKMAERPSFEEKLEDEIEESVIGFEQKISPAKAEIVMVTPGSTPTSPKFIADKIYDEGLEIGFREPPKLSEDIKQVISREVPVEEIIEELIITKKKKITIEVIEYITVMKRIPRERVIYIIEEIIINKGLSRESVVDDPEILRESVTPEKRMEVEDYIVNEYIVKGKRITIEVIQEISIKKVVPKKIVIEIIEEIVVKRKIARQMVLDVSEEVLSEIVKEKSPEESPEQSAEEQITPKIDITAKRESVAEVSDAPTGEKEPITSESITSQKRAEVEEYIVNEYVTKGDNINIKKLEEICAKKKVPKRIIIEIIDEIIIKRKMPRHALLNVTEEELTHIIKEEAISEPQILSEKMKLVAEEELSATSEEEDVEKEVDGFVSIPRKISDAADARKKSTSDISPMVAKEHEKDVIDDFEAVEQEYKVRDVPVTSPEKAHEMKEKEDVEESMEDTTSEVIEADEKFVQETKGKAGKEEPQIVSDIKPAEKQEVDEREASAISEIVDTTEKYLDEAKEKTDDILLKETTAKLIPSISDKAEKSLEKAIDEKLEMKEIESALKEKVEESQLETKDDKSKPSSPIKDETLKDTVYPTEKVPEKVTETVKPETKLTDATGFTQEPKVELFKHDKKSDLLEKLDGIKDFDTEIKETLMTKEEKSPQETLPANILSKIDDGTVTRMLVTACSEDGKEEIEICPTGSITFTKTLEKDSISTKSAPEGKDKITPEDSSEKSLVGPRDSQDLDLKGSDKIAEKDIPKSPKEEQEESPAKEDAEKIEKIKSPAEEKIEKSGSPVEKIEKSRSPSPPDMTTQKSPIELTEKPKLPIEKVLPECKKEGTVGVPKTPESFHSEDVSPADTIFSKSPTDKSEMYFAKASIAEEDVAVEEIKKLPESIKEIKPAVDKELPISLEKSEQDIKSLDKSSSVLSDKVDEKETDKPKSPSIIEKETISEKLPIFESEHYDEKGPIDEVRSPSAISDKSDERKEVERSKSPSIAADKPDLQDVTERYLEKPKSPIFDRPDSPKDIDKTEESHDKARSPSIASDKSDSKKVSDRSRSPSVSVEKIDFKDMDLPIERTRSPSIASVKDDKADDVSKDALKSPKCDKDKSDLKDTMQPPLDKSRSPSVTSESKEPDRSKSPSIAGEKPDMKDVLETPMEKSRSPSVISVTSESKEPVDRSKSPSIAGEKIDLKDVAEAADRSKSPSVTEEKPELTDVTAEKSRSSSITGERKEPVDRSKSPSIAGEKIDLKDVAEAADHLKSPSVTEEKPELTDVTAEKSRSSSITGERKEPVDRSRSPSIAGEKIDLKDVAEAADRSKSPSVTEEKPELTDVTAEKSRSSSIAGEQKEPVDRSKSPSIVGEKIDLKDVAEAADRSKSPSVTEEKPELTDVTAEKSRSSSIAGERKEPVDRSKSPSIAGEKIDLKDVAEAADRSKSPSVTEEKPELTDVTAEKSRSSSIAGERKEPVDRSKSPSIAGEKTDLKDVAEAADRSKSPSVTEEKPELTDVTAEKSRSSSIAGEQKEPVDRSKSPSIAGEKIDLKDVAEAADRSKSPSVTEEKPELTDITAEKSRSSSIAGERKESVDRSKSPSIAGEKIDLKDVAEAADRSKSLSVTEEKPELTDVTAEKSRSSIAEEQKEPVDRSKSPSIAGEKIDLKDVAEAADRSKSPTVTEEKPELTDVTAEKSRSSSIVGERKEPVDRSKSPSIAGEKIDLKDVAEAADHSKSPSVSEEKPELTDVTAEKSRSSSIAGERKEPVDRSKSPSIAGEKIDLKDVAEAADHLKSPSVTEEKPELTDVTAEKSRSSSITGERKESFDCSKSPSITGEKPDLKDVIERPTDMKGLEDQSKSPSSADLTDITERSSMDKSKSPSIASITSDQKESIEKAKSPTISDKKEELDRSKSPSMASEKSDEKKSADGSRATSVTEEKPDLKDVIESPANKSRSPSVASEKAELFEKSTSPTVSDKLEPPVDRSKSPSVASDKSDEKASDDKGGIKEHYESAGDKSPSLVDVKIPHEKDVEEKPSIASEKIDVKPDDITPHDRPVSPSIFKPVDEQLIDVDGLKTSGIIGELSFVDKTRSLSIISDKTEPKSPSDVSKSPSSTDEQKDKSGSSSVASEKHDDIDIKVSQLSETKGDRPISPSLYTEKVPKAESAKSSRASSPVDKTPKDRSRSQSVFDVGEKTPASRSRTASLFEDKLSEKLLPQEEKDALYHDTEKPLDEKDEYKKDSKSPITSPETIEKKMQKIREKRFADFKEPDVEQLSKIEKSSDDEEEDVVKVTAEKKAEIEKYILDEFIVRKRKISLTVIERLVMMYSVPQFIVMEIIEDIISQQNMPKSAVFDFIDDEASSEPQYEKDSEAEPLAPQERAKVEEYIIEEFIAKNKKITPEALEEMVIVKSVPRYILITIIEEIIVTKKIPRNTVIEGDLEEKSLDIEKKEKPLMPTSVDLGKVDVTQEDIHGHEKPGDTTRGESPDGKVSASPSLSPEPIPSDKSTNQDSPRSEPHIDEEILISEEKRIEIEKLLEEEYIKKGKKITEMILEEIIIKTSLPRYIILEIVEEIILKRKIPRESVIDVEIYQEEEPEEDYDKGMYHYEGATDVDYELPHDARKSSVEYRIGMYPESGERQLDKPDYPTDYESQFHKAFVGGMTEMRTTHITTLSGKSTPEFTQDIASASGIESTGKAAGKLPESTLTTTHITRTDVEETVQPTQTVTILRESKIAETIDKDKPEETARISATVTSDDHATESDDDVIVSKKIIKREVIEGEESGKTTEVVKEIKEIEPQEIVKEIKRPSIQQDEPEAITKIIKREIVEHDEPEVTTKVVKREIIEQDEPEIITKVIRREIIVPDEEAGDSKEDSDEYVKTITTKTTRTIVTEELPDVESAQIDPSKIYTDPTSGTIYRVVSDEGAPDATTSADVKRIVTTVTTITGPDGKVITKKDVKESTDTLASEELLEKLTETTKPAEKIIKETITTVTSGTTTPDVKAFYDSGKSTPDLKQETKLESTAKEHLDTEKIEHPVSPLIRELISEDRSYSGKSSPDISLPKDIVFSGKSTPEIPTSPLIRDGAVVQPHASGRSTPDKRSDGRSSTGTPEGFRSGEMIRTIVTTTKMISDEGEIVTTTREVTETTNEKGETVVLAEKTDVKVDERLPNKDAAESAISSIIGTIKSSELQRSGSPGSDVTSEKDHDPTSPPSEHSGKATTHQWGSSEQHTYSDDEPPSSPLSSTSQVGYSPQMTSHYEPASDKPEELKQVEFSAAAMSSSFYGELPAVPPQISAMKTFHGETGMQQDDSVSIHSRFTVEKEPVAEKPDAKRYVDEADLDFDKALMEHKEKESPGAFSSGISPRYTNGSLRHETTDEADHPSSSFRDDAKDDSKDSKKDPLEGWGSPLGLPSPKPPRKFNLKNSAQSPSCSSETTSDTLNFDVVKNWGEPLRLPSPAPVTNEVSNKGTPGTPKKERKQAKKVQSENIKNKKRSESPGKNEKKVKDSRNKVQPVYMDLAYVPHHGNSYYTSLEFFKRVRARYYVFSGTEPSREVYDALLEAKKTWEDKDLEVTMIPTYDTDTLGYWVADNEEALAANHIDLSPSASRCTINLQDHETSCSAYRLEF